MCSTAFRIWDQLELDSCRGYIEKVVVLHKFSSDEVYQQISRFISLPPVAPDEIAKYLKYFSRPLYLAELLDDLFQSKFPLNHDQQRLIDSNNLNAAKISWIVHHMVDRYGKCKSRAQQKLQLLSTSNHAIDFISSRALVNLLCLVNKLSGGIIGELEADHVVKFVDQGVGRIEIFKGSTNYIRIADVVVEDALTDIEQNCSSSYQMFMRTILDHSQLHTLLFTQDTSFKGHLMERALALVVMMCDDEPTLHTRGCNRAGTNFELQIQCSESD
jgi:hypothetical protein